jgi:Luciferase-like monooxygenase
VAIRAAWSSSGEPLTHSGKFHQWNDAIFALPKRRGTTPPIWVAAQGPRACRVAGQHGDGWIFIAYSGFDAWLASTKQVVAGAEAAGRNPDSLVRSVFVAPLLVRNQSSAEEMARQPMVQASALIYPGKVWAAAGATHPLGADFAGVSEFDPVELQSERLARHGKQITAELIRKLFLFGTACDPAANFASMSTLPPSIGFEEPCNGWPTRPCGRRSPAAAIWGETPGKRSRTAAFALNESSGSCSTCQRSIRQKLTFSEPPAASELVATLFGCGLDSVQRFSDAAAQLLVARDG